LESVITTPCGACSTTNARVTNQDVSFQGRVATLSMVCNNCHHHNTVHSLPMRRLFPERPPEAEQRLEKSRQKRRREQRIRRGWTAGAALEQEAFETPKRLRDWGIGGRGIIEENLKHSAAVLLTGQTMTQQQTSAELVSQLPLSRRTIANHAPFIWHAARKAADDKCREFILRCRHKPQLRVCIDGGWDHRRDGSHSELIILDQETYAPFMCITISKHTYGNGKDGKYQRTRVGNYDKEHSNGMEGAAWKVRIL